MGWQRDRHDWVLHFYFLFAKITICSVSPWFLFPGIRSSLASLFQGPQPQVSLEGTSVPHGSHCPASFFPWQPPGNSGNPGSDHQSFQRYTPWWTTQLSLSHPVSTFHALIILLIKATFNCVFVVLVVAPESKRPGSKGDELAKPSMDEFRNKRRDFILCLFIQTLNNKAKMMHFEKITTSTWPELFLPSQNSPHFRASGLRPPMPLRVLLVTIYGWLFPWARLPWWLSGKESTCQCRRCGFEPRVKKIPWRRKWQPIPVFLPEKPYRLRSLAGYSPWVSKDSDMT